MPNGTGSAARSENNYVVVVLPEDMFAVMVESGADDSFHHFWS